MFSRRAARRCHVAVRLRLAITTSNSKARTIMITGAHSVISSTNAEADRVFLRDVLKLTHVDVGHGWLIFGLPPAEVAVHPSDKNNGHEFYLMCADIEAFVREMNKHKISCGPVQNERWGLVIRLNLPGGGQLGVYQPRHARPNAMPVREAVKNRSNRTTKKSATPSKPQRKATKG